LVGRAKPRLIAIVNEMPRIDNVAPEDAHLLRLLANAGAVFHVRTNQPQSLMVGIGATVRSTLYPRLTQSSTFAAATTSQAQLSTHTTEH
jgi:hypothetical protein